MQQNVCSGIICSMKVKEAAMKRCKPAAVTATGAAVCFSLGVLFSFFLPYYVMIIILSALILLICAINIL